MIGSYHTTAEYVYLPPDQVSTIYLFKNIEIVAFCFQRCFCLILEFTNEKLLDNVVSPDRSYFRSYSALVSDPDLGITFIFLKVWWHAATLFHYFYINGAYIQ
jgi:hypothetical protein